LTTTSFARTRVPSGIELVCTAERARGYKPDSSLFHYLIGQAAVPPDRILHAGQSQFADLVGGKPLDLTIAWINGRGVALDPAVPRPDVIVGDVASLLPLLA
jgi:2-haloacid dehalogenase